MATKKREKSEKQCRHTNRPPQESRQPRPWVAHASTIEYQDSKLRPRRHHVESRDTTQTNPSHRGRTAMPTVLPHHHHSHPLPHLPSLPAATGADPPVATLRRALWGTHAIDRAWRSWTRCCLHPSELFVTTTNQLPAAKKETPLCDEPVEPDPHRPGPPMTQYDLAPRRTVYGARRPRPRPRCRQGSSSLDAVAWWSQLDEPALGGS